MRAKSLYSRARQTEVHATTAGVGAAPSAAPRDAPAPSAASPGSASSGAARPAPSRSAGHQRLSTAWRRPSAPALLAAGLALCLLSIFTTYRVLSERMPPSLTQDDIDKAVKHTWQHHVMPSPYSRAYDAVAPSVVRVVGHSGKPPSPKVGGPGAKRPTLPPAKPPRDDDEEGNDDGDEAPSVGTGVVVLDNGTILTNLHVVAGAQRVSVEFANGLVSGASLMRVDADHDLAVLRADRIPDDLKAATLRGGGDLRPGDEVAAVGFPFGIGPSVSGGVVSGLHREFAPGALGGNPRRSGRPLSDLIQFDAAANPGNSGGPLVTMDGEVVGIVTAILNPNQQRTFVGIGFAVPIDSAAAAVGMPPF